MNTGIDGGMNRVFASKLPDGNTGLSEGGDGQSLSLVALSRAPGTIPSTVNPPRGPVTSPDEPLAASMAPAACPSSPAPRRAWRRRRRMRNPTGFFSSLARKVGFGATADTTASAQPGHQAPAKPKVVEAKRATPQAPKPARNQGLEARNQAGRRPSAAETLALRHPGQAAAASERRPGRRLAADHAGEFVREPFLGGEVSQNRES